MGIYKLIKGVKYRYEKYIDSKKNTYYNKLETFKGFGIKEE